jgi:hypothetical protein
VTAPDACFWLVAGNLRWLLHTAGRVKQAKQALQCLGLVRSLSPESLFPHISIEGKGDCSTDHWKMIPFFNVPISIH